MQSKCSGFFLAGILLARNTLTYKARNKLTYKFPSLIFFCILEYYYILLYIHIPYE